MAPLNSYRLLLSTLSAAIALFTGQAWAVATNIPITNFSFESPVAPAGPTLLATCPTGWTCNAAFTAAPSGVYKPGSNQYMPGSDGLSSPNRSVPDGTQVAFMATQQNGQSLTQNTIGTFETGRKYTLTAYAGFRLDDPSSTWGTATLQLLAANAVVSSFVVPALTRGQWALETLTYTATAADNGKIIGVGLLGSTNGNRGVQINWDDVVLVPEPSILLLLAMGFGSLAFARRKRKNPA